MDLNTVSNNSEYSSELRSVNTTDYHKSRKMAGSGFDNTMAPVSGPFIDDNMMLMLDQIAQRTNDMRGGYYNSPNKINNEDPLTDFDSEYHTEQYGGALIGTDTDFESSYTNPIYTSTPRTNSEFKYKPPSNIKTTSSNKKSSSSPSSSDISISSSSSKSNSSSTPKSVSKSNGKKSKLTSSSRISSSNKTKNSTSYVTTPQKTNSNSNYDTDYDSDDDNDDDGEYPSIFTTNY